MSKLTTDELLAMTECNLGMEFEMHNNETEEIRCFVTIFLKGQKGILLRRDVGSITKGLINDSL